MYMTVIGIANKQSRLIPLIQYGGSNIAKNCIVGSLNLYTIVCLLLLLLFLLG